MARRFRADEPAQAVTGVSQVLQACQAAYSPNPVPPQNNHGINTACFQTSGFSSLVAFTWSHEGQHITLAQQEAGQPNNDIYAAWDPSVRGDSSEAFMQATGFQNDMNNRVVEAANQIHTGDPTGFQIWSRIGPGIWQWDTIRVEH